MIHSFINLYGFSAEYLIILKSIAAILISFAITISFGSLLIKKLKEIQREGQPIRDIGPKTHLSKAGTPTMGGLMILLSIFVTTILLCDLTNIYILTILFVMISFAALGFFDDYYKLARRNHHGISGKTKMLLQIIFSLISCVIIFAFTEHSINSTVNFPFFSRLAVDIGYFYIPFSVFVIVASSNSVNLTDGLDGLAIVPVAITASCFAIISYLIGDIFYEQYYSINQVISTNEITIFCCSIIGSSLAFLYYNIKPAQIFMGDTGSLSLGAILGTISIMLKQEIIFAIIGFIFVIETVSVIIQVYYFKVSGGKRFFLMAPIHHHFEKLGWSENKVVLCFWMASLLFAIVGLSLFYIS